MSTQQRKVVTWAGWVRRVWTAVIVTSATASCANEVEQPLVCPACPEQRCPEPPVVQPKVATVAPTTPKKTVDPPPREWAYRFNSLKLDATVVEVDDATARVDIRGEQDGTNIAESFQIELSGCLVDAIEADIETVFADEEQTVIDVRASCRFGGEIRHLERDHGLVAIDIDAAATVLFTGRSEVVARPGLQASGSKLEFYYEAGKISVYAHEFSWCDRAGLKVLTGHDRKCDVKRRRLRLVKRIGV